MSYRAPQNTSPKPCTGDSAHQKEQLTALSQHLTTSWAQTATFLFLVENRGLSPFIEARLTERRLTSATTWVSVIALNRFGLVQSRLEFRQDPEGHIFHVRKLAIKPIKAEGDLPDATSAALSDPLRPLPQTLYVCSGFREWMV